MTPELLQTLNIVRDHIELYGYAPTLAELGRKLGCSDVAARKRVDRLVHAGKIARVPGSHRGISIVDSAIDLSRVDTGALRAELARRGMTLESLSTGETRSWSRHAVTCAVDTCDIEVQRGHLMCRRHWFSVPRPIRDGIMRAFGAKDVEQYQHLVWQAREIAGEVRA